MADNVYEGLFILDTNRYSRDPAGVSGRVAALIEKHGGTLLANRLWEERRLAYPIKGHKKGTYWLSYFRIDGSKIAPMTEEAQREDNFLRQLFLKVDPRIVDTLVSHAQERKEGTPAVDEAAESKTPDADDKTEEKAKAKDKAADEVEVAAAE